MMYNLSDLTGMQNIQPNADLQSLYAAMNNSDTEVSFESLLSSMLGENAETSPLELNGIVADTEISDIVKEITDEILLSFGSTEKSDTDFADKVLARLADIFKEFQETAEQDGRDYSILSYLADIIASMQSAVTNVNPEKTTIKFIVEKTELSETNADNSNGLSAWIKDDESFSRHPDFILDNQKDNIVPETTTENEEDDLSELEYHTVEITSASSENTEKTDEAENGTEVEINTAFEHNLIDTHNEKSVQPEYSAKPVITDTVSQDLQVVEEIEDDSTADIEPSAFTPHNEASAEEVYVKAEIIDDNKEIINNNTEAIDKNTETIQLKAETTQLKAETVKFETAYPHPETYDSVADNTEKATQELFDSIVIKVKEKIGIKTEQIFTADSKDTATTADMSDFKLKTADNNVNEQLKEEIAFFRVAFRSSPGFKVKDEINALLSEFNDGNTNVQTTDETEELTVGSFTKSAENELKLDIEEPEKDNNKTDFAAENTASDLSAEIKTTPENKLTRFVAKAELPPHVQVSEQIIAKMNTGINGTDEFEIQLTPEELGKITIKLVSKDSGIDLEIIAERPETAELLKNKANDISDALKVTGTQLEKYAVNNESSTGHQSYLQQESNQGGRQHSGEQESRDNNDNDEESSDTETVSFMELIRSMA